MGAYVETPADVDRLMALTSDAVGLLFDAGHITFAGGDPLTVLDRHIDRVCHVHCKDVRPEIIKLARNRNWSFLDAVINGAFTVPGDGAVEFPGDHRALEAAWISRLARGRGGTGSGHGASLCVCAKGLSDAARAGRCTARQPVDEEAA